MLLDSINIRFYLIPNFDWSKNVSIFGVHNSLSTHTDDRRKYIFVLGKEPTQRLDNNAITAEAKYSINFTESK